MGIWDFIRTSGDGHSRRIAQLEQFLPKIATCESDLKGLDSEQLRKRSLSLRFQAKSGTPLAKILPEAFALVRIAAQRTLGMRHYDVQLLGGVALFQGSVAEMETGEGKTLTATLPLYLRALLGKGTHLATVNDYLAQRDAEWKRPLFQLLGLSVGVLQSQMQPAERAGAYGCDITYGTAKEFGFDFLRDRLALRRTEQQHSTSRENTTTLQRPPYFALVDEADSVFIDEARTPLIISARPGESQQHVVACFRWSAEMVQRFCHDEHFTVDPQKRQIELTLAGRQLVRALASASSDVNADFVELYEYVERAIRVQRDFHRDREYVVRDGEVVIVEEYTGRLAEGRKWGHNVHQAVEAKEGLKVSVDAGHAARITIQDFFLRYPHLAGMTGTARSSARELKKIYRLPVVSVPTNRPVRRQRLADRIFPASDQKWEAIVQDVRDRQQQGRPVLVGTRSIDKSEALSRRLTAAGIPHQVLNARHHQREADIIAQAGQPGKVTIATNMAGRGVDIKLGPGVKEIGGLYVICTELHDSARIDRQLAGRCGRQGDPGEVRTYQALDDDILRTGLGAEKSARLRQAGIAARGGLEKFARHFARAQRLVERRHFSQRRILLYHEKQRRKMAREMGQDPYLDVPD